MTSNNILCHWSYTSLVPCPYVFKRFPLMPYIMPGDYVLTKSFVSHNLIHMYSTSVYFFFFFRGKTVYVTELMLETLVWELFLQETHWIRGYFGRKNTAIFVTRKHGRSHEVINRGHGPPQHKHTQSHSLLIIADRSTWLPVVGQYNIFDIDIYNDYLYLAQDLTSYMQQSFCICAELHECFPSCELCFLKWAAAHPVCWKASVSKNIIHILWCF